MTIAALGNPGLQVRPGHPDPLALEKAFTRTYQEHETAHPALRESACRSSLFPAILTDLEPDQPLAGGVKRPLLGFASSDFADGGYYCHEAALREKAGREGWGPGARADLEHLLAYWAPRTTKARTRSSFSPRLQEFTTDDFQGPGCVFPLYRIAGTIPDFSFLLGRGIPGLEDLLADAEGPLFQGLRDMVGTLGGICAHYESQARSQGRWDLAESLRRIRILPPATFQEALQLFWLAVLLGDWADYGRLDMVLGPYLERDLRLGLLEQSEAQGLLIALVRAIPGVCNNYQGRVVLGGLGRPDVPAADLFALMLMDAAKACHQTTPQLTLRMHAGLNPALVEKAFELIGDGLSFPILYNDEVLVPAVEKALGVPREDALDWVPFSCGEFALAGKSVGSPNGLVNLLKCLELALHNGVDPMTGRRLGPATGDPSEFSSFEELWDAYRLQAEFALDLASEAQRAVHHGFARDAAYLMESLLLPSCLERRRGLMAGGPKYSGGIIEVHCNSNVYDSLAAVKRIVYGEKALTLGDLVRILDSDFAGQEPLRRRLLRCPKFGNDDDEVDGLARAVYEHFSSAVLRQDPPYRPGYMASVVIHNGAHVYIGAQCGATPDGRKRGSPTANGLGPQAGLDTQGPTALFRSVSKLDPGLTAGTALNIRLNQSWFSNAKREKLLIPRLIQGFWDLGGAQVMITAADRETLIQAQKEPEKHRGLIVRMGGYSCYFVELQKEYQDDLILRSVF